MELMTRFLSSTLAFLGLAALGQAACDLQITSIYSCNSSGVAFMPVLGDNVYYYKITFSVTGNPNGPYSIRFDMAGKTHTATNINTPSPGNYQIWVGFTAPLDGPFPAAAVLDPDQVAGDTNLANNSSSIILNPVLPSYPIEFYDTVRLNAYQSFNTNILTGNMQQMSLFFGLPTTESSQRVISAPGMTGGSTVLTQPFSYPFTRKNWFNLGPGQYFGEQSMTIEASKVRINSERLRRVTWHQLLTAMSSHNLPGRYAQVNPKYLQPEATVQCKDPEIANFVNRHLPANFRQSMAPIDAARELFKGVMAEVVYQFPPPGHDAITTVLTGLGDCGGFTTLYVAACRRVGIPSRKVTGWLGGTNQIHAWAEIWLPQIGWIPQDVTFGNSANESGQYAYYFASAPDMNNRISVSRGGTFGVPEYVFSVMQGGSFLYFNSNATYSVTTHMTLFPG